MTVNRSECTGPLLPSRLAGAEVPFLRASRATLLGVWRLGVVGLIACLAVTACSNGDDRQSVAGVSCPGGRVRSGSVDYESDVVGGASPADAVNYFLAHAGRGLPTEGYRPTRTATGWRHTLTRDGSVVVRITVTAGKGYGVTSFVACQEL
jgi:hypothetical protein